MHDSTSIEHEYQTLSRQHRENLNAGRYDKALAERLRTVEEERRRIRAGATGAAVMIPSIRRNPTRRLEDEDVRNIRQRYQMSDTKTRVVSDLAACYNISASMVYEIVKYRQYQEVAP
jgi:hypothetical protein